MSPSIVDDQVDLLRNARKPVVPHYKLIVGILLGMYAIYAFAMMLLYTKTRCPYSTLTACQAAMRGKCGSDQINNSAGCSSFVGNSEPCYCHECRFCLNEQQRDHCNKSQEERMKMCVDQMSKVDQQVINN